MPAKKKAPKRERVTVQKLRTLGDVEPSGKAAPKRPKADKALAAKAADRCPLEQR